MHTYSNQLNLPVVIKPKRYANAKKNRFGNQCADLV